MTQSKAPSFGGDNNVAGDQHIGDKFDGGSVQGDGATVHNSAPGGKPYVHETWVDIIAHIELETAESGETDPEYVESRELLMDQIELLEQTCDIPQINNDQRFQIVLAMEQIMPEGAQLVKRVAAVIEHTPAHADLELARKVVTWKGAGDERG